MFSGCSKGMYKDGLTSLCQDCIDICFQENNVDCKRHCPGYTAPSDTTGPPPTSWVSAPVSQHSTEKYIGIAIGIIVLLLIIGIVCWKHRKKRGQAPETAFVATPETAFIATPETAFIATPETAPEVECEIGLLRKVVGCAQRDHAGLAGCRKEGPVRKSAKYRKSCKRNVQQFSSVQKEHHEGSVAVVVAVPGSPHSPDQGPADGAPPAHGAPAPVDPPGAPPMYGPVVFGAPLVDGAPGGPDAAGAPNLAPPVGAHVDIADVDVADVDVAPSLDGASNTK